MAGGWGAKLRLQGVPLSNDRAVVRQGLFAADIYRDGATQSPAAFLNNFGQYL